MGCGHRHRLWPTPKTYLLNLSKPIGAHGKNEKQRSTKGTEMARPKILSDMARSQMAKSYDAGTRPSELAREYGVSMSYVINVSREWQASQMVRRLKSQLARARQNQVEMTEPEPIESPFLRRKIIDKMCKGRKLELVTFVKLPYVSIQAQGVVR